MKGLVIPSKVRMNQEGWTMMNILRFFFSLWDERRREFNPPKHQLSEIDRCP